jgi:uracil-DNA glycosylase
MTQSMCQEAHVGWNTLPSARARQHILAFVTIHPSYLLRIEDRAGKEREYRSFVADLRQATQALATSPARSRGRHMAGAGQTVR